MRKPLHFFLCCVVALTVSCQAAIPPPTLQPGEVEVPFETLVLDEEGATEITQGPQLLVVTNANEAAQLQPLIDPEAFQQLQQVDFATHSVLALFRVPGAGCSAFGVTIERLLHKANILVAHAYDWRPLAGHECAETSLSAYHLVTVLKTDEHLEEIELVLQSQPMERSN